VLVIAIFAVNVFFRAHAQYSVLQAFMFSLAPAAGLTPQLLKGITGVKMLSLHHDISTVTGEEVVLFTMADSPLFRAAKKQ
jgi:hypothetical protein